MITTTAQETTQPMAMSYPNRFGRGLVVAFAFALALTVLVAVPASAHPFVRGGEVPVDSLATLTMDLAHGCDSEEAGAGLLTTDVALEVPDWLRIVDVPEPDGWTVTIETSHDDPRVVEVVDWSADDPQEAAPVFDVDVVASGDPGEERYLRVFQACGDVAYRWVGTPDEPADQPAVRVRLVEADPDSPPPPEPEPEAEAETDDAVDGAPDDEGADPPDATDDLGGDTAADEQRAEATAGSVLPWVLTLGALLAAAAIVGVLATRRRGRQAGTTIDEGAGDA